MKYIDKIIFFSFFFVTTSQLASDKVLIFTTAFNRPDFIEIQKKTFDKFLKEKYEFIVFDDALNETMSNQIKTMCNNLGLEHIRLPQHLHHNQSAGHRHMDGIRFALEKKACNHNGLVMMIDSDMFLLQPFSVEKLLAGMDLATDIESRNNGITHVPYLNPMLVFFNMNTLPNKQDINFNGGVVEGNNCDVGGNTYYYLKNNPQIKINHFGHLHIGAWKAGIKCTSCTNMSCNRCTQMLNDHNFNTAIKQFIYTCPDDIEFFLENTFLHYRSGSNWNGKSAAYHQAKTNALNTLLQTILQ